MWIKGKAAHKYISSLEFRRKASFESLFPKASGSSLDLLEKLLNFNPTKRITAETSLQHPYLEVHHNSNDEPTAIPILENSFNFETIEDMEKLKKVLYEEIMRQ